MPSIVDIDNVIEVDIYRLGVLFINLSPYADLTLPSNTVKFRKDYRSEVV
jgi:hypothetical protein